MTALESMGISELNRLLHPVPKTAVNWLKADGKMISFRRVNLERTWTMVPS